MNLQFKFSYQYNAALNGLAIEQKFLDKEIKMLSRFWKKDGKNIEKALKEVTGLSFKKKEIPCYINSEKSLSDPLSLKILNNNEYMQNDLIHELIHVLITQNYDVIKKGWLKMKRDFSKEKPLTISHILVHAVHYLITKKLYPKRDVTYDSIHKDYVRSWKIVLECIPAELVKKYIQNPSKALPIE